MEAIREILLNLGCNPSADGTEYLARAVAARISNPKALLLDLCADIARGVDGLTVPQMQFEMRDVIRAACADDEFGRISKKLQRPAGASGVYALGDFVDLVAAYVVRGAK